MFGKLVGKFVPVPFGAYEHGLGWVGFQGWSCMQPLGIGNIFRSHPWSSWYTWWCDGACRLKARSFCGTSVFFVGVILRSFRPLHGILLFVSLCEKWRKQWPYMCIICRSWKKCTEDLTGMAGISWSRWTRTSSLKFVESHVVGDLQACVIQKDWVSWRSLNGSSCCFTVFYFRCFTLLALSWWLLLFFFLIADIRSWRQVIKILVVC